MFFKKYEITSINVNSNYLNVKLHSVRIKKFFLKLAVNPVRGLLNLINLSFCENNEIFFQNTCKNKNFMYFNFILNKWLVLKKNKIFF